MQGMCKKIALKVGKDKVEHEPDKESVILALKYLDKPFLMIYGIPASQNQII